MAARNSIHFRCLSSLACLLVTGVGPGAYASSALGAPSHGKAVDAAARQTPSAFAEWLGGGADAGAKLRLLETQLGGPPENAPAVTRDVVAGPGEATPAGRQALLLAKASAETPGAQAGMDEGETDDAPPKADKQRAPRYAPGSTPLRLYSPGPGFDTPDFREVLGAGLGLSLEGTPFQAPDWREPLRNVSWEVKHERVPIGTEGHFELRAEGNVTFTLDTMRFRADSLYANTAAREFLAEGNVVITQDGVRLDAERIEFRMPERSEGPGSLAAPPIVSGQAEGGSGFEGKMGGVLVAERMHISEPLREVQADYFRYDFAAEEGALHQVKGLVIADVESGPAALYFGAESIRLMPNMSAAAKDFWVAPCDVDPPPFRIRIPEIEVSSGEMIRGSGAQLVVGKTGLPLRWPKWAYKPGDVYAMGFDFDSGRGAETGYFVNFAQFFHVSPYLYAGYRLYPTEKQGMGFGVEGNYDYMERPASPLFRSKGDFRVMATTKRSGHAELFHRHELAEDTVARLQVEQWFERDFVKEFYYDEYRHRTEPRTFLNVTHTKPTWLATGTVRASTNGWVHETERLPEFTYHRLEQPISERVYLTLDTIHGYYEREPQGPAAWRSTTAARLTLDASPHEALGITPFAEAEATFYSDTDGREGGRDWRVSADFGVTVQSRFHKIYPGALGFSAFKHLVVPSLTLSYRPETSLSAESTPRFDVYDNAFGRARVETKLDNILYGRDAETGKSWQVARLTLYQGTDFWNEVRDSSDYELELDIRPRPWWGWALVAERHEGGAVSEAELSWLRFRRNAEALGEVFGEPEPGMFNTEYGDYNRVLTQFYYDDKFFQGGRFSARIGFAFAKTLGNVYNQEVLYGASYHINDKWSAAFEHRYDFERDELYRQEYEVRRRFRCWEGAVKLRDRREGWDISFSVNLTPFRGSRLGF